MFLASKYFVGLSKYCSCDYAIWYHYYKIFFAVTHAIMHDQKFEGHLSILHCPLPWDGFLLQHARKLGERCKLLQHLGLRPSHASILLPIDNALWSILTHVLTQYFSRSLRQFFKASSYCYFIAIRHRLIVTLLSFWPWLSQNSGK